jgi:fructose-specific phosphotransferase system IIC component
MTNADYVAPITFSSIINQVFLSLKQQYQLIISVLLSSLSMNVLHLVVNCSSFANIWSTLKHVLTSPSNSQIMQLHGSI